MNDLDLALRFAAALGLGVLLGLERERTKGPEGSFAGVRTFGLMALTGAVAGYVDQALGLPLLALAMFASVAALVVVSYVVTARRGDVGGTSEVSAVLALAIGLLCQRGQVGMAAALAVASTLVLVLKDWLHRLASRVESADVEATLKFAIITLIVLPLVPDRGLGPPPLDAVNPRHVWLMVVLISGLNFASYILVKVVGTEHGITLGGVLGGLVSSTALTLGFSQRSRQPEAVGRSLALGILIAWGIMFFRIIGLVALVNREMARLLVVPLTIMGGASLVACLVLWHGRPAPGREKVSGGENPFELGQAIQFGLLYGVVTFVAKAAARSFGDAGIYLASGLAGLTDVDAIALSMASMTADGSAAFPVGARAVVIAVLANTAVKAGIAATVGSPTLRRAVLPASLGVLAAGALATMLL